MARTFRSREDCLEFIEELGYRFPDMTDDAVMLAFDEYSDGCHGFVSKFSPVGREIINEYEKGVTRWETTTSLTD